MLSCDISDSPIIYSALLVRPDPKFGYPCYRMGAFHDVWKSELYLIGGLRTNVVKSSTFNPSIQKKLVSSGGSTTSCFWRDLASESH